MKPNNIETEIELEGLKSELAAAMQDKFPGSFVVDSRLILDERPLPDWWGSIKWRDDEAPTDASIWFRFQASNFPVPFVVVGWTGDGQTECMIVTEDFCEPPLPGVLAGRTKPETPEQMQAIVHAAMQYLAPIPIEQIEQWRAANAEYRESQRSSS